MENQELKLNLTRNYDLVRRVITVPELFKASMSMDGEVPREQWLPKTNIEGVHWFQISTDTELFGVIRVEDLTNTIVVCHSYILPQYWGKDISSKALNLLSKYLSENSTFKTMFTYTPDSCEEVKGFLTRTGFKHVGEIEQGISWEEKLQSIHMYTKDIYG